MWNNERPTPNYVKTVTRHIGDLHELSRRVANSALFGYRGDRHSIAEDVAQETIAAIWAVATENPHSFARQEHAGSTNPTNPIDRVRKYTSGVAYRIARRFVQKQSNSHFSLLDGDSVEQESESYEESLEAAEALINNNVTDPRGREMLLHYVRSTEILSISQLAQMINMSRAQGYRIWDSTISQLRNAV